MRDRLLLGLGRFMIPVPRRVWQRAAQASARRSRAGLAFTSEDHHRVRDFAVSELSRAGVPLAPDRIAEALGLSLSRTTAILEELEKHLTFLFRNEAGAVTWAYPLTVEHTPHHAHLSTGEDAYSP